MRSLWILLILGMALPVPRSFAQSLAIAKKGETNYWIDATAPQGNSYTLQATANLHLWADIHDVPGQYSYQFTGKDVSERYFRLISTPPAAPDIRIVMLGDSMTSDCCGWGQGMYQYFKPNASIINYAMAYTSTKVFLRSPEKDNMLLIKPNYVLIQYGYMDQAWGPVLAPDTYSSPTEFADNLRTIANMVLGFNGVPILVTLHSARVWDTNGVVIPTWKEYNDVVKSVAAELHTPLLDLNQLSLELFNKLGPSINPSFHWPAGVPEDVMHMSPLGAQYVAQLVVNALPDALGPYLIKIFDPPPLPQ